MSKSKWLTAYVHWPYCNSICSYCGFNKYRSQSRDALSTRLGVHALRCDLRAWRQLANADERRVETLFFGGGSPSLLPADALRSLIDTAIGADVVERNSDGSSVAHAADCSNTDKRRTCWNAFGVVSKDRDLLMPREVTLEANPEHVVESRARSWRAAGISRLSIGVQSLGDAHLRTLSRTHSGEEARRAVATACSVFDNVSADLIVAVPGQTSESVRADVRELSNLGVTHLSIYELTFEQNTLLGQQQDVRDRDWIADVCEAAASESERCGFARYEVSNYARGSDGANQCQHNSAFWAGADVIGAGPGAASRLTLPAPRAAAALAALLDAAPLERRWRERRRRQRRRQQLRSAGVRHDNHIDADADADAYADADADADAGDESDQGDQGDDSVALDGSVRVQARQLRVPSRWAHAALWRQSSASALATRTLTLLERRREQLLLGLRTARGVDRAEFDAMFGCGALDDSLDLSDERVVGLIERDVDGVRVRRSAFDLLDAIGKEIIR